MMSCGTILCAIPAACWERRESPNLPVEFLRRFFLELETLERRLCKEVAFEDECSRYSRLCGQIEQVAIGNSVFAPTGWSFGGSLRKGTFPAMRVGSEYVDLIRLIQLNEQPMGLADKGRLGASIFNPRQLKDHLGAFRARAKTHKYTEYAAIRHRLWFLKKRVLRNGCGLIEVPDALSPMSDEDTSHPDAVDGRSLWGRFLAWLTRENPWPEVSALARRDQLVGKVASLESDDWKQYGSVEDRGDFMQTRLRRQIQEALSQGAVVTLMNQRQNMATQIFHEFIHRRTGEPPAEAAVTYADGGNVRPFPLRCLPRMPVGWAPTKEFHIGLISMRHLPIDQYIDVNWYRNIEVPTAGGLAAADEACFQFSLRQFAELLSVNPRQRMRLHVYHTGYMPAVVGFYRAVVATLASGKHPPGCIQVLPKLQPNDEGGFVEGRPWPE